MRYVFWVGFVASAFFALAAHSYYFVAGYEAIGAFFFGALIGCGFAVATMKRIVVRFRVRLFVSALWVGAYTAGYLAVFFKEVGYFNTRLQLIITGAVLASLPVLVWLVRKRVESEESIRSLAPTKDYL